MASYIGYGFYEIFFEFPREETSLEILFRDFKS